MDSAVLQTADDYVHNHAPSRHSLLVVRNGCLVFEHYYNGLRAGDLQELKSMSKSVDSIVAGIVFGRGWIRLDDRVFDYFPEYADLLNDPRKANITLRHLLTMSGGFDWDEEVDASPWILSSNWNRYLLGRSMSDEPGARFVYNTAGVHLLATILAKATGRPLLDFARDHLFTPLGISAVYWPRDPQGYYAGGFRMRMTARDMAKLGYLYSMEGAWENGQIVSPEWVNQSLQVRFTAPLLPPVGDYGYLWWHQKIWGHDVWLASGYGGQYIFIVPSLHLVAVTTAYGEMIPDIYEQHAQAFVLLQHYVMRAVLAGEPSINLGGVVNAASYSTPVAPDSFVAVYGSNFTPLYSDWNRFISHGALPTAFAGVQVFIGGRPCYLEYASPKQINVLVPADLPAGPALMEIVTGGGTTRAVVTIAPAAPGIFSYTLDGKQYAAALHANSAALVAPAGAIGSSRPATASDYIELYTTGLGLSQPHPPGMVIDYPYPHPAPASISVEIGGVRAVVLGAWMTYAGLYQVNIQVPQGVPAGEQQVVIEVAGVRSTGNVVISVAGS